MKSPEYVVSNVVGAGGGDTTVDFEGSIENVEVSMSKDGSIVRSAP